MDGDAADVRHRERVVVLCVFGVFPAVLDEPAYDAAVGGEIGGTRRGDLCGFVHVFEERDELNVHVRERLTE